MTQKRAARNIEKLKKKIQEQVQSFAFNACIFNTAIFQVFVFCVFRGVVIREYGG